MFLTHLAGFCIYRAETNQTKMKLSRIFAIISIALSCALLSSCSKNEPSSPSSLYGSSIWAGNYPAQLQNNDTGEFEDHTACISLEFNEDASECVVMTGIVGLLGTNRSKYSVKWYSKETFSLCETQGGQTIQYYSGTMVSSSTMSFEFLSCDKVERTVELRWMNQIHIE